MSIGVAVCLICGEPLEYRNDAQKVCCHICGKEEMGHSVCTQGHYVCNECHRSSGVEWILDYCRECPSKNPIEIAQVMMEDKSIFPNGPEHHTLVGAALLCAYANAGGEIDLDRSLTELKQRSLQVPGGTCGFWGTCGAATSAGQFYSIISGSTPMTREPWAQTQRLTSRILGCLADIGGPRCCKRTSFIAIRESVIYVKETQGILMEMPERIVCTHSTRNRECLRIKCPFFKTRQPDK